MDFRGLVWKRVWKITFFGLKSGQDLENQAAHPHQEFPGVTPPPGLKLCTLFRTKDKNHTLSSGRSPYGHIREYLPLFRYTHFTSRCPTGQDGFCTFSFLNKAYDLLQICPRNRMLFLDCFQELKALHWRWSEKDWVFRKCSLFACRSGSKIVGP